MALPESKWISNGALISVYKDEFTISTEHSGINFNKKQAAQLMEYLKKFLS